MTEHRPQIRKPQLTTARLMLVVLLCSLIFWFVVMKPPAAFHQDYEHFGIYKAVALVLLAYVLFICLWGRPSSGAPRQTR